MSQRIVPSVEVQCAASRMLEHWPERKPEVLGGLSDSNILQIKHMVRCVAKGERSDEDLVLAIRNIADDI